MKPRIFLVAGIIAVLILACGGNKPPNGPEGTTVISVLSEDTNSPTRAAKIVSSRQYYAVVDITVTKNKKPFGGSGYFVKFEPAISGRKHTWNSGVGIDDAGKAYFGLSQGYYRARVVRIDFIQRVNVESVVGEWASIPINAGRLVQLHLPIGEQAKTVLNQVSSPVVKPAVEILSPRGGEIIPRGPGNFLIEWRINNYDKLISPLVNIELIKDGVVLGHRGLLRTYPEYINQNFSWEVGTYYDQGGNYTKVSPGRGYRVRITVYNHADFLLETEWSGVAESGDFTITSPITETRDELLAMEQALKAQLESVERAFKGGNRTITLEVIANIKAQLADVQAKLRIVGTGKG